MSNEPNKPIQAQELTEKELEGIVGGESMVTELVVRQLVQDALQQELQKKRQRAETIETVSGKGEGCARC